MTPILLIALLAALYLLSLRCRRGHQGLAALRGWKYAHRGLHDSTHPENSMSAFQAALDHGFGIELDIHLLKDGNLAVIHDSSLRRTAGAEVNIEDLTTEDLTRYQLIGSGEPIPAFSQVLELFDGKAPMIVELKTAKGNHAALAETACRMLDAYNGPYCIESFDPRCIYWLKKHRPDIIRGQLVENFLKAKPPVPRILQFIMTYQLANFLIQPDFVAHRFQERKTLSNFLARKLWGAQGVSWTIRSPEHLEIAVKEGYLPIFEDFSTKP